MAVIEHHPTDTDLHPIDIVESLASQAQWDFDRVGENEIAMAIEGQWRTYSLSLAWTGHDDLLRLLCTFEIDPPAERRGEFLRLLNLANDRIWGGAFVHWPEQRLVAYRGGLTLAGGAQATPEQIEAMVLWAVGLSERFYPAFQLVGWSGEPAEQAVAVAIGETFGTA